MKSILAILFFAATTVSAQQSIVIQSVTPNSGPAAGGTVVTIKATGFAYCVICSPPLPPPEVLFGGISVPVTVIDENTLQVVTPPHLPGAVTLVIEQGVQAQRATLPNGFTFTGTIESAFERLLLPVFAGPVSGANDSVFITILRLANRSSSENISLFGIAPYCALSACIPFDLFEAPYTVPHGTSLDPGNFEYRGRPGAFLYAPKSQPELIANLRVYDQSRSAFNFGTEMQVVRDREFSASPIKLLGMPLDPRFRNTLRVYAKEPTSVRVTFGNESHVVQLTPGADLFEPAYGSYSTFPIGTGTADVTIEPIGSEPVWAFISVTNNDTQLITTISPQR